MSRRAFWALLYSCLSLAGCDSLDVELLSRPVAVTDAAAGVRADAAVDLEQTPHRPAPDDAGPPDEPPDPPVTSDGGVVPSGAADAAVMEAAPPTTIQWLPKPDLLAARGALGAASFGGEIHLLGGDVTYEGKSPSTAHRIFDPVANGYASRAATPDNHQWGPCVVVYENYLYAFGGWSAGSGVLRRYDFELDKWDYLAKSPEKQMWGFACAVVKGVIYIVSGATNDTGDHPTNKVSAYNIATNTWSRKADYPGKSCELSGAAIDLRLYVVGRGGSLDIFDTTTNTWSTGPAVGRDAARALALSHDGLLYVFGGKESAQASRFDPKTRAWNKLPPMSSPRGNAAGAAVGNEIHVFGGFPTPNTVTASHEALYIPRL